MRARNSIGTLAVSLSLMACGPSWSSSDQQAQGATGPTAGSAPGGSVITGSGSSAVLAPPGFAVGVGAGGTGGSLVSTPPVASDVAPAPINGGTLLVARDGVTAVAADPDRDRVSLVDLNHQQVIANVQLDSGDEPGRVVEDASRRVHVVLRHSGQVATIALDGARILERRSVCAVPQGIAYDPAKDVIHVACTSGELVTLPASGGAPQRNVHVDIDLRDVLVSGDRLFVTRFKSAELLELDASGSVINRTRPSDVQGPFFSDFTKPFSPESKTFQAAVAWRTVVRPNGTLMMLHQRGQSTPIALGPAPGTPEGSPPPSTAPCASGAPCAMMAGTGAGPAPLPGGENPYGAQNNTGCDSILHSTVSELNDTGVMNGPALAAVTLAVDAAMSPDGKQLAIAVAGSFDDAPTMPIGIPPSAVVADIDKTFTPDAATHCATPGFEGNMGSVAAGQVIAVAFDPQGRLVMQSRDPNLLSIWMPFMGSSSQPDTRIDLGGAPRRDTGHDLFHTNAGVGLACASCHPGGGDDGRTWNFQEQGPRRTQLFNMGIRDTLPLHWDGELPTFDSLITEVFERRMGGQILPPEHVQAMSNWMNTLHPNAPMRAKDDPAAVRGRSLFESADVGCSSCHNGAKLTNNHSVDVGTGGTFQVPSLVGVAYHEPYIHDGCASTLRQRFDPACGGMAHGQYQNLSANDVSDLVAYLESL